MSETRSCSRWADEEVERELAEMTGSLEQLAGLEEKEEEEESGSSVHGSSKVRGLFNRRSAFWRGRYLLQLQRLLAKRSRAAVLQSWWKG